MPNSLNFKIFKKISKSMDELNVFYIIYQEINLYMNYNSPCNLRNTFNYLYDAEFYYKFSVEDYNLLRLLEQILFN